jgi:hypothetical protein
VGHIVSYVAGISVGLSLPFIGCFFPLLRWSHKQRINNAAALRRIPGIGERVPEEEPRKHKSVD